MKTEPQELAELAEAARERARREQERDAKAWTDLAESIERAWCRRFRCVAVAAQPYLEEIRRRGKR